MSLQAFKSDSYSVGGWHRFATKKILVIKTLKVVKYKLVTVQFVIEKIYDC